MVDVGIDLSAFEFEQGIRAIELMWIAGCQVLDQQEREVLQHIVEFDHLQETACLPEAAICDDEDYVDEGRRLRLELLAIGDARTELNNATTISLYHHWERYVPGENATKIRGHRELHAAAVKSGIELHDDLSALVSCANYLKHGNPTHLNELKAKFSDRFPSLQSHTNSPSWLRRLRLTDDHIKWMFEIVKESRRPIFKLP